MPITVYHNPRCSKSRATLALLEERGLQPTIVHYLETPPDAATLASIRDAVGRPTRELVRTGQDEWSAAGLDIESASEAELLAAIAAAPILLQRPILVVEDEAGTRARIGRPPEAVLDILP
jgi:arsenate reductase